MAQFENMRKIDLKNGEPAVFSLRQLYYADIEANRIGAIVYMDGEPFALSGTCTGTAIRADGATVPMTGTVDGNQAYITLNADCYAVEGDIQIFVKLTTGTVTATLAAARGTVRLTETGAVIDPGEIIPSVSALITAIDDAVASIPADYSDLLAAIAPDYTDLTFPVTAGTWCWHEGSLYRATVDIPSTESWTAAHWETAPLSNALAGDIADLKMNNRVITVTGTTPTITASAGAQYICGEVATLNITLPGSGIVDIIFQSGSTPTVLTITPPTGVTVKWANGFDPINLEANTTYELNIKDGLGVAASWA